ncbi:hypothetical protein [Microbacterium sp. G2-8]|uniref:hypothetical protein n=1 Tax=Microbacterium sp. G2-8 TaxID=2842454 RepID=UPI001C894561|nr:hypothetical protein [Microbacterium sp. G2-8]
MDRTTTLGLEHYARVIARHWVIICLTTALGVATACAALLVMPARITATTHVNLSVITTDPFGAQRSASGLVDTATETAIAESFAVADRAALLLGGEVAAPELHDGVEVTVSDGGTVAGIAAVGASSTEAIARADAVAAAYLAYRSETAQERLDVMITRIDDRVGDLRADLSEANATIAADPQSVQAASEREQILAELTGLTTQRNTLQSVDTTGGSVLTRAADSPLVSAPSRTMVLATGGAAGLLLGIVFAFVRDPFDRRLRTPAEIERRSGRRILAHLRTARPAAHGGAEFDIARERLLGDLPLGASTIGVIDDTEQPGATARGLAHALADSGQETLLLLPPESRPRVTALRGAPSARPDDREGVPGLTVRTCIAPSPATSPAAQVRDAVASAPAGAIVLVAVSAHDEADMLAVLRCADVAVAVVREGDVTTTTVDRIREATEQLDRPLLGTIVLPRAPRPGAASRRSLPVGRAPRADDRMTELADAV